MKLTDTIKKEYEHVEKKEVHTLTVPKTQNVDTLLDLYTEMQQDTLFNTTKSRIFAGEYDTDEAYNYIEEQIKHRVINKKLSYTSEDITSFSFQVTRIKSKHTISQLGLFLSSLVNENFRRKKIESPYLIYTRDEKNNSDPFLLHVDFLGYKNNGANVLIFGTIGNGLCTRMSKGIVTVEGTCKDGFSETPFICSEMRGGSFTINGDVFASCGYLMKGGSITINGEVKKKHTLLPSRQTSFGALDAIIDSRIGFMMQDGIIHVQKYCGTELGTEMTGGKIFIEEGDCTISARKKGGEIYYKGVLQEK